METTNTALGSVSEFFQGLQTNVSALMPTTQEGGKLLAYVAVIVGVLIVWRIVEAILVGAISRGKGYSFFGNFLLGLLLGRVALIYAAGRTVSYEHSCVMQDRLAMETAKEMYKLQRARERAQLGSARKQED